MSEEHTKEELDAWFRSNNPDPWGYDSPYIQERLDASLVFVQRFVPHDFDGVFVEIGPFNGDFTRRIAKSFPNAKIVASDKVRVAWELATSQKPIEGDVRFQWEDMKDFELPSDLKNAPTVLLLLECLYYQPEEARRHALRRLFAEAPGIGLIFVSGPLGDPIRYFSEKNLVRLMGEEAAQLRAWKILNTKSRFLSLLSFFARGRFAHWSEKLLIALLDRLRPFREHYANQVIYCFRR